MDTLEHLRVDPERLLRRLDELASIGARPDGGVTRLAFSDEDRAGRDWVERQARQIGLDITIDRIGNLLAVSGPGSGPVVLGSHTDTVGAGGKFDGALGVVAALEAVQTLLESGHRLSRPLGLASFVNEEGVRFMPDMMGSLFACGAVHERDLRSSSGTDGTQLGEALDATGMSGAGKLDPTSWSAFVELHIEQGPVLETSDESVGIVTGVQGLRWLEVRLRGKANHAGTTPMDLRSDAMLVAAHIVSKCRRLTRDIDGLRATVGRLVPEPNMINVMPDSVQLTIDIRHPDPSSLNAGESSIRTSIQEYADREGVEVETGVLADAPSVEFDRHVVAALADATEALGLSSRAMISGAGHDAQIVSRACPAAMVFVPSVGGISHSPEEYSTPEACVNGANVLLGAAIRLAAHQP